MHIDGTSKHGNKYVALGVTTPEGTYSLGYTSVATEDTSTLVDISIQMLEEVSDVYCEGASAQETFTHLLSNLSAVMSDRTATMKSYGRSMEKERQELLQTDEGLQLLHCNAHFLLGLSSELKKLLLAADATRTEPPVGFTRAGEPLAFRFVFFLCVCVCFFL